MDRPIRPQTERTERIAYLVAAVVLTVSGVLLRSVVLNWIVGPGLVVVIVTGVTALARRWEARS